MLAQSQLQSSFLLALHAPLIFFVLGRQEMRQPASRSRFPALGEATTTGRAERLPTSKEISQQGILIIGTN